MQVTSSGIQNIHHYFDIIPVVSTFSNIYTLFLKAKWALKGPPSLSDHHISYHKDKSVLRCVILLVPIIGNVLIYFADKCEKNRSESSEDQQTKPEVSPQPPVSCPFQPQGEQTVNPPTIPQQISDSAPYPKPDVLPVVELSETLTPEQVEQVTKLKTLAKDHNLVAFYKDGLTSFLSNFYPSKIDVFGKHFLCVESAFQWKKATLLFDKYKSLLTPQARETLENTINQLPNMEAQQAWATTKKCVEDFLKSELRGEKDIYPNDWLYIRFDIMWECLDAKFKQNTHLMALLKATNGAYLLEHNDKTQKDYVWSDNNDGNGLNFLGLMLMDIRKNPTNNNARFYKEKFRCLRNETDGTPTSIVTTDSNHATILKHAVTAKDEQAIRASMGR